MVTRLLVGHGEHRLLNHSRKRKKRTLGKKTAPDRLEEKRILRVEAGNIKERSSATKRDPVILFLLNMDFFFW